MGPLFEFTLNPLELVIRGTTIYWFLFLVFRFVTRRDVGAVGIGDILLLVIIADAAQNAMSGEYKSIADGLVLVSTIVAWNWALDWATYSFPAVRRVLEPAPLPLVIRGKVNRRNLRRELITYDELLAKLREKGIENLEQVKLACMESDGEISVLQEQSQSGPPAEQQQDSKSGRPGVACAGMPRGSPRASDFGRASRDRWRRARRALRRRLEDIGRRWRRRLVRRLGGRRFRRFGRLRHLRRLVERHLRTRLGPRRVRIRPLVVLVGIRRGGRRWLRRRRWWRTGSERWHGGFSAS